MDTIAAVSTPLTPSAVGILRISGPLAVKAANAVFAAKDGVGLFDAKSHRLIYGAVKDLSGRVLDFCMCCVMRAPHSYTGEDLVELFCHGSPVLLTRILSLIYEQGVRAALPGEFTRRAYLNGKLDLSQAEAVADLISAQSDGAVLSAAGQLGGAVSRQVHDIYGELTGAVSHFQAIVDFPEEDVDPLELSSLEENLKNNARRLSLLTDTYERGRILREGAPCAIIGKPNVGKSSVLNTLLGYDRAIVTHQAGTTRDTLEELVNFGGVPLRLTDTAGLRKTDNEIEAMGVMRAQKAAHSAHLLFLVLDGSKPLDKEDEDVMELAEGRMAAVLINKCDLPVRIDTTRIKERFKDVFFVSAKTGEGFDKLKDHVQELIKLSPADMNGSLITNARHFSCIKNAAAALDTAVSSIKQGMTEDVVLTDVEQALQSLGEVTGANVSQDIVDGIFSRFCVGK